MAVVDLSRPVATPPPGVTANFSNPPNESVLAYSCVVVAFATLTFFAWFRFLVKYWIVKTIHVEDYLIPFAWLAAAGNFICGFLIFDFAPIIHSWDMQLLAFSKYSLLLRISGCLFNISILLIKCSILIQVLRVFVPRGTHSKTYWLLHILIIANIIFHLAIAITLMLSCKPITKAWHPWEEGKCFPVSVMATTSAVVNLISDLSILGVTQWVVWNVIRADGWKRVRLSVVFLAGIVPCAFASVCLFYIYRELTAHDFVHDVAIMTLACYGELSSAMFVLFLPVLPKFFSHLKSKLSNKPPTKTLHKFHSDDSISNIKFKSEPRYKRKDKPKITPTPQPKSRFPFIPHRKHELRDTTLSFVDIGIDSQVCTNTHTHTSPSPPKPTKAKTWGWRKSLGMATEKSRWHISYTQRGGEDGMGEAFWREEGMRGWGDVEGEGEWDNAGDGEKGMEEENENKMGGWEDVDLEDEKGMGVEGPLEKRGKGMLGEGLWEKQWGAGKGQGQGMRCSSVYSQ